MLKCRTLKQGELWEDLPLVFPFSETALPCTAKYKLCLSKCLIFSITGINLHRLCPANPHVVAMPVLFPAV